MIEGALLQALVGVVLVIISSLVTNYIKETKHEKTLRLVIGLLVHILDTYEIPVPNVLQKIIDSLHSTSEKTDKYEQILLDEKIKKSS